MLLPQLLDLALQRHQAGQLAEAEALYRKILAVQPSHADALHYLGVIAHQAGRDDLAVEWIRRAIAFDPNNPVAHSNLGEACRVTGRLDEAIAALHRALELRPDYPEACNNLSLALRDHGQLDAAMAACRRALQLKPEYAEAHYHMGNLLRERGLLDEATAAYHRALELKPAYPDAHNNLGYTLRNLGRFPEAIASYRRALQFQPDDPDVHNNLGNALRERGQLDDAVAAYRRALQLKPDFPEAHNNLGLALRESGELDGAIAAYRRALELKPKQPGTHSNLIFALHFHPRHDVGTIAEEHQRWNRQFAAPLKPLRQPRASDSAGAGRLRIGYVSPDFREHVVGRYVMPLFQHHDRQGFEILCYSGVARPDRMTERFRALAGGWRETVGVSDADLAKMTREDKVDILIDLSLHTRGNRLLVFARQPASVQVSFAGYPGPSGLEAIPYRISDRYLEAERSPTSMAGDYALLVQSYWCYDPCGMEVEINPAPALESGTVTFGCLGNFSKVGERVLALWARVLRAVPNSRLLLWSPAGTLRERTTEALRREGIEGRRVTFVGSCPRREYLELYNQVDIVLDTFPYNGHTTTLDALWMGTPVISLAGNTPVSRAGLSQLSNLGLPEWAVHSETEYVDMAASLAGNLPRLAELRSTLRPRMQASPLMDAPRFARNVEAAYRSMWERCRLGEKPG